MYDFVNELITADTCEDALESLKKIIGFDYACVSYGSENRHTLGEPCGGETLCGELKVKKTCFGQLLIERTEKFTKEEARIFKTCAAIFSNIIKNVVLSQIAAAHSKEMNKNMKKLYAAQKVRDKFLANVSHELRTPLNAIIGFSDLLIGGFVGDLGEKQKEYVDNIKVAGTDLVGMINSILDMSKLEAGATVLNLSGFPLKPAIEKALQITEPIAKKKGLDISVDVEDVEICADYQKLQHILLNLLSNALKFANTSVKIIAERNSISVSDDGIGIDKKYHRKIFKKFEQINPGVSSTGLGLTIVKEFAKLHGWKIKLDSAPGKGTKFTVIFS